MSTGRQAVTGGSFAESVGSPKGLVGARLLRLKNTGAYLDLPKKTQTGGDMSGKDQGHERHDALIGNPPGIQGGAMDGKRCQ